MKYTKPLIAAAALALLTTATGFALRSEQKPLVVSTFGLATNQMKRDVLTPFTKATGESTRTQFGDSAPRYTQIAHNPNSGVDVVELAQSNTLSGVSKGLFQKLDFSKLTNFKDLSPAQQRLAKQTNSVPFTVNAMGIVYDPKKAGKITSWDRLWSPKLTKKIAIPDIATTFGPGMLYVAGDHAHVPVPKDNGTAAFKALAALKPNVVKTYAQSSDLVNMFKTGEITAAVVGDYSVGMLQASQPDLRYVVPQSGTYANYNTMSILKTSTHQAADYRYLNWRISKKIQTRTASPDSQNNAPVNTKVKLSAQAAKNKTYGPVVKRAKIIDFAYVNAHLNRWVSRWNHLMNH